MHAKLYDSSECFSCIIRQKVSTLLAFQVITKRSLMCQLKLSTANNFKSCLACNISELQHEFNELQNHTGHIKNPQIQTEINTLVILAIASL